jgi:hypothetical protein
MRYILLATFTMFCCVFAHAQHTYTIHTTWDGVSNTIALTQHISWTNTSDVARDKIVLLDWNHAYASERSPLGKFLSNEYDYKLIRTKKQKRGVTSLSEIRHEHNTLEWSRLKNQIDIIEVSLPKAVVPNGQFSFSVHYTVQLPDASIFKFGAFKNELCAQHWHLVLAQLNPNGTWVLDSNLGFGNPISANAKTTYSFDVPPNVNIVLPTKNSASPSQLLLTKKDSYKQIPFGESELITDMLPSSKIEDFEDELTRMSTFIKQIFPISDGQVLWALQKDYARLPLLMLESMPPFVKAFDKNQLVELKLLKTLLEQCVQQRFGKQHENSEWITDGLPYFLWQKYVNTHFPDLNMTGNLNTWPIIKNYHFTQAPYYRSWEIAANVSANKNRGQSLVTPKNKLTRYNRRVANPYRAALALLYLDAYLGNNSVANAIKSLPKNSQIDRVLKQDLAATTTKPIDWFFEHYIKLDNNIDLSVSANKIKDDSYALTVESTQKNIAIPLSITTQDGKQNTIWIADGELNNTQVIHGKDTASLTLNKDHYIPELSLNNNTYNLNRKIFRNNLRPRLLQDIPQSGTSVVLLSPEFRYNVYDGLLAGITVGNSSLLSNNFGFKFSPQYGTKSGQTNGLAYVVGNLYHNKKSHYLTRITLFGSSYNYAANKRYSTFTPSVQFYFRPNGIQQKDRSYFLLRHISVRLQDLSKNDSRRSYGVSLATFQSKSGDALQNIFYRTELQVANAFKKLSAESEYITYYLPNRRLTLRLFAGGFLHNTTNDSYYDFNASRVNDYLFQYDLYGRSENDGFFSQQYIKAEGALRTTGNVSGANKWMLTAQTTTTLWRWIEAYAEVGWLKNSNQKTQTHWGTGVSFNLIPDFFEVHFPVYDATGNLMTNTAYAKQIRFQLSLRPAALAQLFSRSWF